MHLDLSFLFYIQFFGSISVGVRNLLWNIYQHYNTFSHKIDDEITRLREPIEKKIRDYIKIVQWNVHTLFAMKRNIRKTHRTLQICFKQYKEALSSLSAPLLTEKESGQQSTTNDLPSERTIVPHTKYTEQVNNYCNCIIFCERSLTPPWRF